ncbi:hypothetical protein I6N90_17835 [Paenibacillus sp. GSMTC-2017]|uniref:hypothetical protein n=1 Tax=Paenibacillus sp. GSMTC-2017 TaxID=2794350 RepID=UPI0018DA2C09|nr:hypothetical protein [Paenibacillus sp. GSMTC-2017]MBH5319660.1 hypothetical protein [Paenibacillus sp. GSMTC-2017]
MKKNVFEKLIIVVICINIINVPYSLIFSKVIPYFSIAILIVFALLFLIQRKKV